MVEVSEIERDMYGVEGTARQWRPGDLASEPFPDGYGVTAEPPGAVTTVTEWTTPKAGVNQFLVNGSIRLNEWAPAGARLGIGVSYPLEPEPPPPVVVTLEHLWFEPTQVTAGETPNMFFRLSSAAARDLSISLSTPSPLVYPPVLPVPAGHREGRVSISVPSDWSGTAVMTAALGDQLPLAASLKVVPAPPPPPLDPVLTGLTFNPPTIAPGGRVMATLSLSRATSRLLSVRLGGDRQRVNLSETMGIVSGTAGTVFPIDVPASIIPGPVVLEASLGGQTLTAGFTVQQQSPPPGPVEVESVTLAPDNLFPGESATLTLMLKQSAVEPVTFLVTAPEASVQFNPALTVPAGKEHGFTFLTARLGASGSVPITLSLGTWSQTLNLLIRTPLPPPVGTHNVKDYGAKGDGKTDDRFAFAAAIAQATLQDGQVLFIPRGTYLLNDSAKVFATGGRLIRSLRIEGEGPESLLLHDRRIGLAIGTGGQPYSGIEIRGLGFRGIPGAYMKDTGNTGQAIQIYGPKGTVVEDCEFWGSGTAVFNAGAIGQTEGTIMRRLRANGWGAVCIFCNGGDVVEDCQLLQDDPLERQENSSHGIYIHSGCNHVRVERVLIERARKYGIQLYGQDVNTTIENVILRDVTMRSCANGLTLQQSAPDRARVKNLLVERLVAEDIYGGPALSVKQGDGARFTDCKLSARAGVQDLACLQLGVWAPYEPGFSVTDMTFEGLTLQNGWRGIWVLASNGGTFRNVRVLQPSFMNCRKEIDFEDWNGVPPVGVEVIR